MGIGRSKVKDVIVACAGGLFLELISPRRNFGTVLLQRRDRLEERALLLLQSANKGFNLIFLSPIVEFGVLHITLQIC